MSRTVFSPRDGTAFVTLVFSKTPGSLPSFAVIPLTGYVAGGPVFYVPFVPGVAG